MDFKFKEVVEESIIYFYDQVLSSNEYTEDVFEELDHVYTQAPKADEYEVKNKELLEELQYLRKVNGDLVWQRDTDEEHEAKAKAWDDLNNALLGKRDGFKSLLFMDENRHDAPIIANEIKNFDGILNLMNDKLSDYESGESDAKK